MHKFRSRILSSLNIHNGEYMKSLMKLCVVCTLVLLPASVWAVFPLDVEETATQGKGKFLFELAGDHVKDGSFASTQLAGIITGGLGLRTDLALKAPYLMLNPSPETGSNASGIGDARLKVKHQLFENEVKQSMAYEIFTDLPTGDVTKGLGTNIIYWGVRLMDSQVCHDNIFHLNVGYEVDGRDLKASHWRRNYSLFAGLAAEHRLTGSFRLLAEIKVEDHNKVDKNTGIGSSSLPVTFLAGFMYDISRSWYVDLGVRAGLNNDAEDVAALAGTAWRF
jgi:hypothetical protein